MQIAILLLSLIMVSIVSGASYTEINPSFIRLKSSVTVRKIETSTLANLDFAAYDKNPVLNELSKGKPKKKPVVNSLSDITFDNLVTDVKNSLSETPLTESEKSTPLAWKPLLKKLWNVAKDDKLQSMTSKIASYKWADPDVFQSYQEISTGYLHLNGSSTEIWVKIEFCPWVNFIKTITDEDGDGFGEIYGKLQINTISPDTLQKYINWVKNDYCKRILSKEEMTDWITDLASYWYPTKNTDILDLESIKKWPLPVTNKKVKKELKGLTFTDMLAVVEGKPVSPEKPIYNVYIVTSNDKESTGKSNSNGDTVKSAVSGYSLDTAMSSNFKSNMERFNKEIATFGSYGAWYKKNTEFFSGISTWLSKFPGEQMGLEGENGWLFFRKSFEYMNGGDYSLQEQNKNPLPHLVDFKKYLDEKNINLLFIVVPNKEEVYYDKIDSGIAAPKVDIVNPYSRKILLDLQNAGVEVIDLLPHFLDDRKNDSLSKECLYQKHDTHWTNRGLQIAAGVISDRIKEYNWFNEIEKVKYISVDTVFERQGDIVERLPEQIKPKYQAVRLSATQVLTTDSALFKGNNSSAPIMLIGDSFTGVFESVDCKSAGIGAHIAEKSGIPVDIITSWGGGPLVRKKAIRARENHLGNKRIVIYMMVARDLFNYSQNWEKFPE